MSYLKLITEDKHLVTYRPSLNKITGSVLGTIFLQQVLYWWQKSGGKPFYKFNAPCNDEKYRPGDSWQEELGFTRSEFETARKAVGQKKEKGQWPKDALIVYWQDINRLTWYTINPSVLEKALSEHYEMQDSNITEMQESSITEMQDSNISYLTENTTKTTQKESVSTPAKTPAHFENFNALMGNGDIALSQDDKLAKEQLVKAIKAIVKDKTSLVKIYDLADTLLEKKITPEILTRLFGAGGWWFTSCPLNKTGTPPYVKNICNELDTALSTLEVKTTTPPAELTPAVIMSHIDRLRGLQNGAYKQAWGSLPPEVTRVINQARKLVGVGTEATEIGIGDLQAVMVKEI